MPKIKKISLSGTEFEITDAGAERSSNKVSSWQSTPDNTHYPSEKLVKDECNNIREIAAGKTKNYVTNTTQVPGLNSQDAAVTLTSFKDLEGTTIAISAFNIGDNIYITNTDVPDRWVGAKTASNITAYKLETTKSSVADVQVDGTTVVSNSIANVNTINSDYNANSNKLATANDLDLKADKSSTVTNVSYANNKISKTINGTTTDVVTLAKVATSGVYNDLSDLKLIILEDNGSTTNGTWLAKTPTGITMTSYIEGQLYVYPITVAGSSTTTININDIGAKPIYRQSTSRLTTQFAVGNSVLLYYSNSSDCFRVLNFYDSDTICAGYCQTSATNAAKAADHAQYNATANSYELMTMRYANTAKSALTMNISSKGAKPIYINGQASSSTNYTLPAGTYLIYYDGTNYYFRTDGKLANNNISQFNNDSGYITSSAISDKIDTAGTGLSKSGTTLNHSNSVTAQTTQAVYPIKIDAQGHISSYGSAVTIPTVNNGTLSIQGNGTTASTFTANQSGNTTLNIKGSGATTVTKSADNEITVNSTDTTYESKTAASGGTDVSLVTTGEKYIWNNKGTYSKPSGGIPKTDLASTVQTSLDKADTALQSFTETDPVFSASAAAGITSANITAWNNKQNALTTQTAYSAKGSSTKVPQITTNNLGQVTGITEVTITQPTVNDGTLTINTNGNLKGTFTANQSTNTTINIVASDLGLSSAMKFVGTTTTALTDGSTTNPIIINGSSYTATAGNVVLYGNKEFVFDGTYWKELGDGSSYALKTTTVTGTGALSGGGDISANRTISHNAGSAANKSVGLYKISTDAYSHVNSVTAATASDIPGLSDKMDKANPSGTGSFSLNRKANTTIGLYSVAEGELTTASAEGSHAEGMGTTADGEASHAEGYESKANYNYSHAEGENTDAGAVGSHTEGNHTRTGGDYAHAEGNNTNANGNASHAEGIYTEASGEGSHAEGNNTVASGYYSHAEGNETSTNSKNVQHVFGEFNALDTGSVTRHNQSGYGTYVEIVGKGTADNARSNARTLDWSGNEVLAGASTATSFIKTGGTSSQFLKADGSVDSNTYVTNASIVTLVEWS